MRLASCVMIALAVVACSGREVAGPAGPLDVSVTLSAEQLVAGDELHVTVRAENTTSAALTLDLGPCVLTYEVLNAADHVVTAGQPCPIVTWLNRLSPGEAYEFTFTWRGNAGAAPGDFLAAGTYRVRGILDLATGAVRSAPAAVRLDR